VGRIAVIGESSRAAGFALAGALVLPAEDAAAAREAWLSLPADVEVVVLTAAAAAAIDTPDSPGSLPTSRLRSETPLTVVMPR
jgi:vacuolar-type H+-ATPase subunit F/Vma7